MARSATAEARPKGEATAGLDHWCYLMYVYILKTESGPWVLIAKFWFADEQKAHNFEPYLKTGSGRAFCKRHF